MVRPGDLLRIKSGPHKDTVVLVVQKLDAWVRVVDVRADPTTARLWRLGFVDNSCEVAGYEPSLLRTWEQRRVILPAKRRRPTTVKSDRPGKRAVKR